MSRLDPVATYLEPIVGWRCWRVLPIHTLSEGTRYRLCAVGTYGLPKIWEPRAAVVARCSDFKSRHEAPYRWHECGIYAYESETEAESKFASMWAHNAGPGVTWAFGRVSLWGRVIECQLGWRAQFAYPYDVAVFTEGKAADAVADEYAIDVDRKRLSDLRKLIARHPLTDGEAMVKTIGGQVRKEWYDKTTYGIADRYFLKPYHEDVCRRLDGLAREVARLERRVAAAGGDDA
jgi:hypothetical protein